MSNQDKQRSNFVTTLAWIFIILSGFAMLISIAQNIMVNTFFSMDEFVLNSKDMKGAPGNKPMYFEFITNNMRLFFALFCVFTVGVFVSSIGLLKRKKWARNIFVFIMVVTIIGNIGSVVFEFFITSDVNEFFNNPNVKSNEHFEQFKGMMIFMRIFTALIAVLFSLFFAWIIKRLVTKPVKYEFE